MQLRFLVLLSILVPSVLLGCGSGGGGGTGSFEGGAATVDLTATPRSIDTGDRTTVRVELRDVHPDGIQLKLNYPVDLRFVDGSAVVLVDEDERDIAPGTLVTSQDDTYLVFYLPQKMFGDDARGTLIFELEGAESTQRATIGVDPDVDSEELFNIENPEFAAESDVDVEVVR